MIASLKRSGTSIPDSLQRPDLPIHLVEVWGAFWDLSRARHYVDGIAIGLSVMEVAQWFDIHQIDNRVSRMELYKMIMSLDRTFIAFSVTKVQQRQRANK